MPSLRIKLFGRLSICGEGWIENLIPAKAKELLCYLLLHRGCSLGREFLACILWAEGSAENSKQYLRKALWQLQRAFTQVGVPAESILQANSQWVAANPKADIWVDVAEFERLCSRDLNPAPSADQSCQEALEAAADLYQGELLEGWYQEWCLYDRERLQNMYLMLLDKVVALSEANQEYEKGVDYATRILKCDRAREGAHQRLMRLRYRAGDRAGALRQYERCASALKEELGVQPSEQTRRLYHQICGDMALATNGTKNDGLCPENEPSLLQRALHQLQEVKAALGTLQNTVDESLSRVRQALEGTDDSTQMNCSKTR
jgi:DNA-binding SARP family transcriptional activator